MTTILEPVTRTVIIPMYREAGRIAVTFNILIGSELDNETTELIFVDDGSDDGTGDVVEKLLERESLKGRLLRLPQNEGKGGAVRAGMLLARGNTLAFADADLSAGVDEIVRCLRLAEDGRADVVVASRSHRNSTIAVPQPVLRQFSGRIFNLTLRLLGLASISDTQCGLKAFRRDAALKIFPDLTISGFSFDVEVILRALQLGLVVEELPIVWQHIEASRVEPIRHGAEMLRDVITLRRTLGPLPPQPIGDTMAPETFDAMAKLEAQHWWFRAKREFALQSLAAFSRSDGLAVDVGCGTGELVFALHELGEQRVVGFDLSGYALGHARRRAAERGELVHFALASAEALPLRSDQASCLVSMDVIEHLDDDVAALREYRRIVRPGGIVLIAVPAYQWAWSQHDESLGHRRRYTARRLISRAREAGLDVERCTYYHSWLTPIAILLRKSPVKLLMRGSPKTTEEASFVHPLVNALLLRLTRAERRVERKVEIPFGLSIMLLARVPPGN